MGAIRSGEIDNFSFVDDASYIPNPEQTKKLAKEAEKAYRSARDIANDLIRKTDALYGRLCVGKREIEYLKFRISGLSNVFKGGSLAKKIKTFFALAIKNIELFFARLDVAIVGPAYNRSRAAFSKAEDKSENRRQILKTLREQLPTSEAKKPELTPEQSAIRRRLANSPYN